MVPEREGREKRKGKRELKRKRKWEGVGKDWAIEVEHIPCVDKVMGSTPRAGRKEKWGRRNGREKKKEGKGTGRDWNVAQL